MKPLVLFLLFPFFCHSQEFFSGKVVELSSGKAIPYATIGLVRQNTGTSANEQGEFRISCKNPGQDSLLISCVGYNTIIVPVNYLRTNSVLALALNEKRLKPVVVKNQWIHKEVGSFRVDNNNRLTSNGYQSQ